jgi:hypothetical protein
MMKKIIKEHFFLLFFTVRALFKFYKLFVALENDAAHKKHAFTISLSSRVCLFCL